MSNILIYSLGCFSFILSCVFFAAIRWGHVCSPYAKYADKFFPARKISIFFLLFSIALFPYVLNPMRTETWMLAKFYAILFMPTTWIILFHKYFDPSGYKREKYRLRLMGIDSSTDYLVALCPKHHSEEVVRTPKWSDCLRLYRSRRIPVRLSCLFYLLALSQDQ